MTDDSARNRHGFEPADYPALRDFFPAYLHQDFAQEYGSAAAAVKGFLADASGDEIVQVQEEWKSFRNAVRGRPLHEIQSAVKALGGAWLPQNEAQFNEVDEILSHAEA